MAKKRGMPKSWASLRRKDRVTATRRIPEAGQLCDCSCGQLAEIEFLELFYTKACHLRVIDELKAAGIPIEESEKGWRLAPGTIVTFADEGDPTKVS